MPSDLPLHYPLLPQITQTDTYHQPHELQTPWIIVLTGTLLKRLTYAQKKINKYEIRERLSSSNSTSVAQVSRRIVQKPPLKTFGHVITIINTGKQHRRRFLWCNIKMQKHKQPPPKKLFHLQHVLHNLAWMLSDCPPPTPLSTRVPVAFLISLLWLETQSEITVSSQVQGHQYRKCASDTSCQQQWGK